MTAHVRHRLPWLLFGLLLLPIVVQIVFVVLPGMGSFAILSGSMQPTIQQGDIVYTYDSGRYTEGDIVTFAQGNELITHRIVEKTPTGYRTKGDARMNRDSFVVERHQIRGELLVSVPLYGYLIHPSFERSWALYSIFVGVLIVGIAGQRLLAID
ncbi:signal peptidase I [Haladaptatus caseinilyticus]|uniref:signal peptidase I n=1 Tax=Haladaptatus caseinilyticus TaxID=2993314 RepID=UPI00224B1E96|nr:signal peptidase I [Haladaptatus caseinilyticus]